METSYLYGLIGACWWASLSGMQAQERNRDFPAVTIPTELRDPTTRASYLVQHYWDQFDFQQALELYAPEATEQALSNLMDLMWVVCRGEVEEDLLKLMGE